ncbi:16652_t:CDS:2, partial [Dentiscutata heterogama]
PSGNDTIDKIIRRTQTNESILDFYWEWIPKDLTNIQYLEDGAISSIYKATWLKGYPRRHNGLRPQRGSAMVALKTLGSFDEATSIIDEFNNKILSNEKDFETRSEIYVVTFLVQTNQIATVMDFYEGGSLRNLLQKQEFSSIECIDTIFNIALCLGYRHSLEIFHCNLHTNNILLTRYNNHYNPKICNNWNIVISDFGLSNVFNYLAATQGGSYGSIPYIAPEIFKGYPHSRATDIYALGMI